MSICGGEGVLGWGDIGVGGGGHGVEGILWFLLGGRWKRRRYLWAVYLPIDS